MSLKTAYETDLSNSDYNRGYRDGLIAGRSEATQPERLATSRDAEIERDNVVSWLRMASESELGAHGPHHLSLWERTDE